MYKINSNYCNNKKQYNEEHQYHNFFHATLGIVNINMTSLDTYFLIKKIIIINILYIKNKHKNKIFTRGNSLSKLINKCI